MVALTKFGLAAAAISGAIAAPTGADAPDFSLGGVNLARRQDYNQNYVTSGSVNFSPQSNGYGVTFSGAVSLSVSSDGTVTYSQKGCVPSLRLRARL